MHYRRLRDLREDHDLTQDQLVAMLGLNKTTYTNYEQGKREIPFALVIRLARLSSNVTFASGQAIATGTPGNPAPQPTSMMDLPEISPQHSTDRLSSRWSFAT